MKGIKNIIFDFGGVLVDLDIPKVLDSFAAIGFDAQSYIGVYGQKGFFKAAECGDSTEQEFLDGIPCDATDKQKKDAWCTMLTNVPKRRRDSILKLKKHYRIFLLSNINTTHWQYSLDKWWRADGLTESDYFEQMFLSFEMHLLKPNTAIYIEVLKRADIKAEETLYIDDSQANCDAVASIGLHTLCATGDEWLKLCDEL